MKRKSAFYFASELQSIIDDLVKDFVHIGDEKFLRVAIPKMWKGRAKAFNEYCVRTKLPFEITIDSYAKSTQYTVIYHSMEDNTLYFKVKKDKSQQSGIITETVFTP